MAKYSFRLATLLKLREQLRDERRAALAEAFHAEQLLDERELEINQENDSLREQRSHISRSENVAVDQLLEIQRYEAILMAEKQTLAKQREMLASEIERRREAMLMADRDVRALEKLRDRQQERHTQEEESRLRNELDEFAAQSHARKDRATCCD